MEARNRWSPNEVALHEEEQARLRQSEQPRQQRGAVLRLGNDRSEALRREESQEERRLAQQAMQIADLTDDLAIIMDTADGQFDVLDTNMTNNIEYALQGTEAVGTRAKGAVMGSEGLGYGATVAVGGTKGTAIGGATGAIGGLLLPVPGGAAAGGVAGAGLGAIIGTALTKAQEDAVRATIEQQLEAARNAIRGEAEDEGLLNDADQVKWKYAELTGLTWSSELTPGALLSDLASLSARNRRKPVKIRWNRLQRPSFASFANADEARAWIRQALRTGTVRGTPATTARSVGQRTDTAPHSGRARDTRQVAAEYGRDEHMVELERHVNRAGANFAGIAAAAQAQGEKANRAQQQALQSNAIMVAAANAHAAGTQRWFTGRFGFGLEDTGLEIAQADAASARAKPRWVSRHEMSVCMICRDPFDSGTVRDERRGNFSTPS
eukprot:COSAG06_NODE_355_length_16870_cov_21.389064_7_plen_439_part_00